MSNMGSGSSKTVTAGEEMAGAWTVVHAPPGGQGENSIFDSMVKNMDYNVLNMLLNGRKKMVFPKRDL